MIEVSFGVVVIFGGIWAVQLLIIFEILSIARKTREQFHSVIGKLVPIVDALQAAHVANAQEKGETIPKAIEKRRSTDIEAWMTESKT